MFGKFIDVNLNSLIGDLPSVINFNNNVAKKEFEYLFDSSSNVLTKSLVAEDGRVKTHWGDFINLKCQDLVIDGTISGNAITELIEGGLQTSISHKNLKNRFSWDPNNYPTDSSLGTYSHDTQMIVTDFSNTEKNIGQYSFTNRATVSLREEIDAIEDILNDVIKNISVKENEGTLYEDSDVMTDEQYDRDGISLGGQLDLILEKISSMEKRIAILENNNNN